MDITIGKLIQHSLENHVEANNPYVSRILYVKQSFQIFILELGIIILFALDMWAHLIK